MEMSLQELTRGVPGIRAVHGEATVTELCCDSRQVKPGMLFFCVPGLRVDGHAYAPQAKELGAAALVVTHRLPVDLPQIVVEDVRAAMAHLSASFFGHPSERMRIVGITGTKGKTTSTYLLKAIGTACGLKTGLMGTVMTIIGDEELPATLTTPDPIDFQRILRRMADAGVELLAMEVSAHALALSKLESIHFDVAVYTNLSQDHLDFFGDMETYAAAKKKLFTPERCGYAAFNADDDCASYMMEGYVGPYLTFGVRAPANAYANDIEIHERGVAFRLTIGDRSEALHLHLSGLFNVYNAMSAAVAAYILGLPMEGIKAGLESVQLVPGRIEVLDTGTPFSVILDYAHSPDGMSNILSTVRQFTRGRVIALFGCGGERDRGKRPIMGGIAGELADYVILTSDNPRSEDPHAILRAIEEGIKPTGCEYVVIENRREAISTALSMAREGDVVVLAGKGHETYQDINGVKRPFDERAIVGELLGKKGLGH